MSNQTKPKLYPFEKKKIRDQVDSIFGSNPNYKEMKERVYRSLIGDYSEEDIEFYKEENNAILAKLEQETEIGLAMPEQTQVIYGKIMSQECIENVTTETAH